MFGRATISTATLILYASPTTCVLGEEWRPQRQVGIEKSGSTIGEGGDMTISAPGRSPKQSLTGIGLHDPLHGRRGHPKFIAFDPGRGYLRAVSSQNGDKFVTSPSPPNR